jgi:conjugative relaxase-like TrwC/TraI family protein
MLRVTTIHASAAASSARYYTRYLADDDGPEGQGLWLGRQATALGIAGPVSAEHLEALLSGCDPMTGTTLGNPLVDRFDAKGRVIPAVAAFDATFSAPKSVSVWWALSREPGLLDAHDIAVRAVLHHLEHYGSTTRVRVDGARQHPDTGGLMMAAFRQATSREDDPQLHTHVVISAKVQTADGRWLALDARYLKRKQRALGGLYQSVLRAELTHRYGVAWGPVEHGQAELAGIPSELLATFSKRTAQVDAALIEKLEKFRAREGRDPSRWERAALTRQAAQDTRAAKTDANPVDLAERWLDEARAAGWTPARLQQSITEARRVDPYERSGITVNDVVEHLSTSGSSWTRADVIQAICDLDPPVSQQSGHHWARSVEHAADQVIAACISLDPAGAAAATRSSDNRSVWLAPNEPHLTHEAVLAQEERILLFAMDALAEPASPSITVDTSRLDFLQGEAAAAVAGDDRLVLVVGAAGTGKTTALRAAVDDLRRRQRMVFGVAPTAKAAKVLHDETGMAADTVAKLLYEWRKPHPGESHRLASGTTLVVDEAGMVGTGDLDELISLAVSQNWRLALVGDPRQLQAVGRGGMFDELCRTGRTYELATIHRFHHRWEQTASLKMRSGDPAAFDAYLEHGRVASGAFDALAASAASRWRTALRAGETIAVVAETNDHVDVLNATVQELRQRRGDLGTTSTRIGGREHAFIGDRVVTRRNDRALRTDRDEPVRNRDQWTVRHIGPDGSLTVSHAHGHGTVVLPADYVQAHVRLGYAATAHGNQGETVDVGITIVTPNTTHRSLYVGATRGRAENTLLVVTDDPDATRDILEHVLTNDRADVPAVARRGDLLHQISATTRIDPVHAVEQARRYLRSIEKWAEPHLQPLRDAKVAMDAAQRDVWAANNARLRAPRWQRPGATRRVTQATGALDAARDHHDTIKCDLAPILDELSRANLAVQHAETTLHSARAVARLDRLVSEPRTPTPERGVGIER